MKKLLFSFILVTSQAAFGQVFQPIFVPLDLSQKIVIRGFKGKLQIVPSNTEQLKVSGKKRGGGRFDQWKFQVRKKQNIIEVVIKGPSETEDWEKIRSGKVPSFDLVVMAPPRALEVFWSHGSVTSKAWKADISVQMTDGKISLEKGVGSLRAQLIRGDLRVKDHKGNLELQTYKGKTFVENIEGIVRVNNFSSNYNIATLKGGADIRNHSGSIILKKTKGHLSLNNTSGVMSITGFSGSVDGELGKGAMNVEAEELQNFVVNSGSGSVTLKVSKKSGAQVHLRSEKGLMRVPNYLRKLRKGAWTEYRGKLKGDKQGQIKIVSQYGNIVLK